MVLKLYIESAVLKKPMHWQNVLGQTLPSKTADDLVTSIQEPVPETCGRQSGRSLGKVKVIMLLLTESLLAL